MTIVKLTNYAFGNRTQDMISIDSNTVSIRHTLHININKTNPTASKQPTDGSNPLSLNLWQ